MNTEHYQSLLETEKEELIASLKTVGRINPSNPGDWEPVPQAVGQEADPNDQADLIEGFEENTAILKDLEIRYNHVLAALLRISNGTYGTCTVCGEAISADRLEANPAAATCINHTS